ncbi:unnamed protein product [Schistosoma mattheei]|uniref:Uncharacterized protein n=1 Tax=Schistosoma mattheei TaxID=31246 RepID=A0A183NP34_9TREM|nr:unnamed protein product [Schistosoma mattheei]
MKQLHDTTKKLAGKYSKLERPVKDKEGRPITEIQQQRNGWIEYFEELVNRPAPTNPPDIEAAHIDLPIDVNPPTKEEIRIIEVNFEINKLDSVRIGHAQTEFRHYGSSSNNQLSGTRHCTSTSLIMKRRLTV